MPEFVVAVVPSSLVGPLLVAAGPRGLALVSFDPTPARHAPWCARHWGGAPRLVTTAVARRHPVLGPALRALAAYEHGQLAALDALPVEPRGTSFQVRVWRALRRIPAGRTWSYRQLAAEVGSPRGARAIGAAVGANPLALVLPCHRVVGADGSLTGFGGGLGRKRRLLAHEGCAFDGARVAPNARAGAAAARATAAAGS